MMKLTMLMLLALLLISHGVGNIRCSTVPENSTDMLALLDFRAATTDPSGSLFSTWNTNIHYCKWRGVTCNPKNHGRVTALRLASQGLSGPIAPSLGNLTFLHTLDLSKNQFSGQIPHLNNLQKMEILNLGRNSLGGSIPDTLTNCSNLKVLYLHRNLLKGAIPREIGQLKNLVIFALNNNNLTGAIPPTLGNITHLEEFYLQENQLEGTIPDELVQFSNISLLGLGANRLSGNIPVSLFNLSSLQALELPTNQLSKILPHNMGDRLSNLKILLLGENCLTRRGTYLLLFTFGRQFPTVSYKDLAQATGNFSKSNLIGRGSYGSVYKGKLTQAKMQVAIKVFDLDMRHAEKSFVSECEVLRKIRHRNLVSILTACSTIDNTGNDFKALIYEFMHNGNLDTWLHHRPDGLTTNFLRLEQRINIAVGIADALAYLHHDCGRPIIHCDLKPINILLDDDMSAHLGDFGIASLVLDSWSTAAEHSGPSSSVAVAETLGYIAPEYAQSVHASTCGDVYSFGIVLLEMLIGKRPTDSIFKDELSIVSFVKRNFPDQMLYIIDAHLREECNAFIQASAEIKDEFHLCLLSLVQMALSCTCVSPQERMTMREVAIKLYAIRKSYVGSIKQEQVGHALSPWSSDD